MAEESKPVEVEPADVQAPVPVAEPAEPPLPPPPPPAAPAVPRLLGGSLGELPYKRTAGTVVNVGDLIANLGDGTGCPARDWPRTRNPQQDRRAFAAAFMGVSTSGRDPGRRVGPVEGKYDRGGDWNFPVRGEVTKGDPLGPAIESNGRMSATVLETCEEDEAIADAVADKSSPRGWKIRLRSE